VEIVTEVYRVKYADSRDLARIVSQLVPGVTVSLGPDALLSRGGAGGSGGAGGQPGEMTGGEAPSATAQQMGAPMQGGGATAAQAAQPPNLLVLVGTAREVLRALELLRKVDVKQPQVIIEAKVLDVSEGSLKSLGLSWGFLQSGEVRRLDREGNAPFPIGDKRFPTQQSGGFNRDGQLGLDFNFVKKPIDFSVTLNALAEDRRNRLLAAGADPHRLAGAFGQGDRGERGGVRVQACRHRAEADRRRQCAPDAPAHLRARTERRARGDACRVGC
jgi:type II secretory pathway component GspD/PulD (secretin)